MSAMDGISAFADKIWNGVDEGYEWIRGVIFGEWQDNRSTSQVVTDALVGFVPGLGSIVTLRDLIAVIFRLAKHPEKREDVSEWILLIAMLLPLIITVLGLAAAGIGALVGEEVGGFFRAVALFLVKEGGVALKTLLDFLHAHGYGAASEALRKVKFAAYQSQVAKELANQIAKLKRLLTQLGTKVSSLHPENWPSWMPGQSALLAAPDKIKAWTEALTALGQKAHDMIPKALIEMDKRLGALLAGNVKGAVQTTHAVATGVAAPKVERAVQDADKGVARNAHDPEPGNTRRVPEKRVVALAGKREYSIVDKDGRPVGAVPYDPAKGSDGLAHKPVTKDDWTNQYADKVNEGYPDLAKEKSWSPGQYQSDYATFSGDLRPTSLQAGSDSTLKRVVSWDNPNQDVGAFANRELPADGEAMRADSAIKEQWNSDGEYVEIRAPDPGDPVWQELHAQQVKDAGGADVPYSEELKMWEGPASSQVYDKTLDDGTRVADDWQLPGGKDQVFMDRDQLAILKKRSDELASEGKQPLISTRKKTNFADFDKDKGNIVPKGGPAFAVVPLAEAVPHPAQDKTP